MKTLVSAYAFDKTARTVTFTGYGSISQERIMLVANVSQETVIYNWAKPGYGGTASGNVLTLEYDTSAMSNSDKLLIVYDDDAASALSKITDGTNTAAVYAADAGSNGQVVGGGVKTVTLTVTANGPTAAIDVSNASVVSLQFTATGSGATFAWQQSHDGAAWTAFSMTPSSNVSTFTTAATATVGVLWTGPKLGKYFRLNVTGTVTGTYTVVVAAHSLALPATQPIYIAGNASTLATSVSSLSGISTGTSVTNSDAMGLNSTPGLASFPFVFTGGSWDRSRVPLVAKSATATASGDTALWTPAAGKKVRLMRYKVEVTGNASTTGGAVIDVVLRDATTALAASCSLYVPSAAGTSLGSYSTGWVDLGQGVLSAAANNVLNINLSAALTTGKVRVVCAGTEE